MTPHVLYISENELESPCITHGHGRSFWQPFARKPSLQALTLGIAAGSQTSAMFCQRAGRTGEKFLHDCSIVLAGLANLRAGVAGEKVRFLTEGCRLEFFEPNLVLVDRAHLTCKPARSVRCKLINLCQEVAKFAPKATSSNTFAWRLSESEQEQFRRRLTGDCPISMIGSSFGLLWSHKSGRQ